MPYAGREKGEPASNDSTMATGPLSLLLDGMLSLLFPPRCEICGTLQESLVCERCLTCFEAIREPYCRQCGLPFDPLAQSPEHCRECRDEPPPFDVARAAGIYGGALRRAVHLFKYDGVRALAGPLGRFLADTVSLPFPVEVLCPVPLHPARQRMRGFNQSLLLAEEVGAAWGVPVDAGALARTRNTTPQMLLPPEERRRNLRGAFSADSAVAGRSVGLVDDVFTTGSTLRECSRALRAAGAGRILVVAVARAVPGWDVAAPSAHTPPAAVP